MQTNNNCKRCFSEYSPYGKESNKEYWCEIPIWIKIKDKFKIKKPKGLCQFCNPKSKFYLYE